MLTLREITGRQVLVRTEATNLCYSNATVVLGLPPFGFPPPDPAHPRPAPPPAMLAMMQKLNQMALIQGHGGIGVVEAVGPDVRRVQVGDRVVVSGTPQCGSCYQCLRGRADMCQFLGRQGPNDLVPIADMRDGTPVYANSHIGGLAEKMVTFEEWVVPVFTRAPTVDLCMVTCCVGIAGLGCTASQTLSAVAPGSAVAVFGNGPLGLSAIQGARIAGASIIIGVDPIRVRREVALKVGATHVLDPNAEGDKLVNTIRELTKGPTTNLWAGGRDLGNFGGGAGPDFVVEAVGANRRKPKLEDGPDPTGVLPLHQSWEVCSSGGHIVTTGLPNGNLTLSAAGFAIGGRTHHAGQYGGANPMRDLPRFVQLLDSGQFDAKPLATTVIPIEGVLDAYEQVVDRTTITAIMTA
jgi:S-(hydroxymethyl)glutathione dehydrogenase/alcohol dehydrogenase